MYQSCNWLLCLIWSVAPAISLLLLLVSVAFFTLLERKVLAYIILRRGPNKPSVIGLLVPFADALKLLSKPFLQPHLGSSHLRVLACYLMFGVPAFLWLFVSLISPYFDWGYSMLSVLVLSSLSVWALIAAGWGSNSKYSTLGGTRCLAQTISYEVCLTLLFFGFCLWSSFNIFVLRVHWGGLLYIHLILILFLVLLAETNRSPFDFAEGESELVSGYNVEYSGPGFVILFLAEYLSILFSAFLTGCLFSTRSPLLGCVLCSLFGFGFIWVRGTLPRFRYDQLIALSWKSLLPIILSSLDRKSVV